MAQSTNVKVKNISGATIKINKAVYINGVSDDDDALPTIALASNNSESKMPAVGLTKTEIANNEIGTVTVVGNIGAIDTNAAKKNNTPVYVGVNGDLLFKNPSDTSDSAIVQRIGTVTLVGDIENGQVYLFPLEMQVKHAATHKPDKSDPFVHAAQHQKGGEDQIDHDKLKNTNLDGHPQYSLVSGRRAFTGTVSGKTPTKDSHLATKGYVDDNFIQGTAASGQVAFFTGSNTISGENNLSWDTATNKLTIDGTTSQLVIKETSSPPSSTSAYSKIYVDDDAVSQRMRYVNDLGYHYALGASNQLDFKNNNTSTLTNTWYYCNAIGPATTTGATSTNTITATPFTVGATRRVITDIGYYNTTVATTNITYAIYEATSETNIYPNSRIFQGTEVAQGAAAGFKTADTGLSLILEPGKLYWIAFNSSAVSCAIRSPTNYNSMAFILGMSNTGTSGWQRIEVASAYASTLPTTFPASAVLTVTMCPTVMFAYGSGL